MNKYNTKINNIGSSTDNNKSCNSHNDNGKNNNVNISKIISNKATNIAMGKTITITIQE